MPRPTILVTDTIDRAAEEAISEGLRTFNQEQSGISDVRPLAVVLKDPESYLVTVSVSLLILNVVAIFYLGLSVARSSGSLAIAMLAQAGYLLFASQLPRFGYVSPEALTIFCASIVMGLLSPGLFSSDPEHRGGIADPILIGFFLALGLISKITFLPVLALVLQISGFRSKLWCLASLLLFSVAFFAPALSMFSHTRDFILRIVGHSQYYGDGPAEFIELSAIPLTPPPAAPTRPSATAIASSSSSCSGGRCVPDPSRYPPAVPVVPVTG